MKILPSNIRMALHQIFDDMRVYSGGSLFLRDLDEAWKQTGLREGDLIDGLEHMIDDGELRVELKREGLVVTLLSYGSAVAADGATVLRLRQFGDSARSAATLALARQRRRSATQVYGRRSEDLRISSGDRSAPQP